MTGGVDTHKDTHTAAVLDADRAAAGASRSSRPPRPATRCCWRGCAAHGELDKVGVEGTGAYGAGLALYLRVAGVELVEVDRPDRKARRQQGKSDPVDAEAAARAAQAGRATGIPKDRDGAVEALRALRVARRSAVTARAQAQTQMKSLIVTAPDPLRSQLRELGVRQLDRRTAPRRRPDRAAAADPTTATLIALRALARRHQQLSAEIDDLDALIAPLVTADQPRAVRAARRRPRRRRTAAGHRRRQPAPAALGGRVRHALRRRPAARLVRAHPAPPAQPRRGPPSQRRALPDRAVPAALGPPHPRLRRNAAPPKA